MAAAGNYCTYPSQSSRNCVSEPTAALDKKSGRDVVEIMQRLLQEQGCTILLVTHDNRILDIADRIIYMEDGRLIARPDEDMGAITA